MLFSVKLSDFNSVNSLLWCFKSISLLLLQLLLYLNSISYLWPLCMLWWSRTKLNQHACFMRVPVHLIYESISMLGGAFFFIFFFYVEFRFEMFLLLLPCLLVENNMSTNISFLLSTPKCTSMHFIPLKIVISNFKNRKN